MKNILSTIVVIAIFCVSVSGAFYFYQKALAPDRGPQRMSPDEAAIEIMARIGEPLVNAWANRDGETLKSLTRGEFGAGIPSIDWTIVSNPPFETKHRMSMEDEERTPTDNFDIGFGHLLDPIAGLTNIQAELSLLEVRDYENTKIRSKDMWNCRVLLGATGVNKESEIVVIRTIQEILIYLPDRDSQFKPNFSYWEIHSETSHKSNEPVMNEIRELVSKREINFTDQTQFTLDVADVDKDQDMDVAMTLANGRRFVFTFDGQSYQDSTESLGVVDGEQASETSVPRTVWLDYNKDGYPDLISGNRMFENDQGKKLVDVTEQIGFAQLAGSIDANVMGNLRRHFETD